MFILALLALAAAGLAVAKNYKDTPPPPAVQSSARDMEDMYGLRARLRIQPIPQRPPQLGNHYKGDS